MGTIGRSDRANKASTIPCAPNFLFCFVLFWFFLDEKKEVKPLCGIKVPLRQRKKIRSRFDFLPILIELVIPLCSCEIA